MRYLYFTALLVLFVMTISSRGDDTGEKCYDPFRLERYELLANCSQDSQVSYEYLQDIENIVYGWECTDIADFTWKSIIREFGERQIAFAMEVGIIDGVDYKVYSILREPRSARLVIGYGSITISAPIQVQTVDSILASWDDMYSIMNLNSLAREESKSIFLDGTCEFIHVLTDEGLQSAVYNNMLHIAEEPYAELYKEIRKTFDKYLKK